MPPGPALVSAKIRPTRAAPRVYPTSRAVARMPLALPARSRPVPKAFPGASLLRGFASLLGRFISLFARLGNLPFDWSEYQ